jgi:zona occludens toxin (predicted ATPase)
MVKNRVNFGVICSFTDLSDDPFVKQIYSHETVSVRAIETRKTILLFKIFMASSYAQTEFFFLLERCNEIFGKKQNKQNLHATRMFKRSAEEEHVQFTLSLKYFVTIY